MIAAVLVRVDDRPIAHHSFGKNALAGRLVAMPDHPAALFAAVATDDMDDRWPVVVIGAMPPLFIGAPARPIVRVAMGRTFFPPRSGRSHLPRRSAHPSLLNVKYFCRRRSSNLPVSVSRFRW